MLELQIAIGIDNPTWLKCKRLDKYVDGRWTTPTYEHGTSLENLVNSTGDTFLHDCFHNGLLRFVDVSPGVICFRKRRGRKMHFMVSGPTFDEANHWIAWDRIERRESGETVYQYFWKGNGETKEITQS